MRLKFFLCSMLGSIVMTAYCQTPIAIPPIIQGDVINLELAASTATFFQGSSTATLGYNGAYLGPTILLNQGQNVTIKLKNSLTESTTIHWHGMHVEPMCDGGPHSPIAADSTWSPTFPVLDKAGTYWYHPHAMGSTMDQVLKCASGIILVKDPEEAKLSLPRTYGVDDFPLVCQWKTLNDTTKQIVLSDEADNKVMVNATLNGSLNVPAQLVRFRLLNGSSLRYFKFAFSDNRPFKQIVGDEGLLDAPVEMTGIEMAPGERAEIIVDFSGQNGNTLFLKQIGTELGTGFPGSLSWAMGPLDGADFSILQFNVVAPTQNPVTSIPTVLTNNVITSSVGARTLDVVINTLMYNPAKIDFTTKKDSVMIWKITNSSKMAHPMHIHGNYFFIQKINTVDPPANMRGRKDVVTVPPRGSVQLIMKYADFSDDMTPYMYHCHILSHEEGGMMGQFLVMPNTTGLNDVRSDSKFSVRMNPFSNEAVVFSTKVMKSLNVINALGQIVFSEKLNSQSSILNVVDLAKGMYIVSVVYPDNSIESHKFLKD